MNKRQIQARFDRAHLDYMTDASVEVEIVKGRDDRWDVRCYNARGDYIGGMSSITDLLVARREAERYAITLTHPIVRAG